MCEYFQPFNIFYVTSPYPAKNRNFITQCTNNSFIEVIKSLSETDFENTSKSTLLSCKKLTRSKNYKVREINSLQKSMQISHSS